MTGLLIFIAGSIVGFMAAALLAADNDPGWDQIEELEQELRKLDR